MPIRLDSDSHHQISVFSIHNLWYHLRSIGLCYKMVRYGFVELKSIMERINQRHILLLPLPDYTPFEHLEITFCGVDF